MLAFLARRLLQYPLILAIIYVTTFLLAWIAPGSPFNNTERQLPPEAEQALREKFNADSAWGFLTHYPWRMIQGDFGPSFSSQTEDVGDIIASRLPISMQIGALAVAIALVVGVILGAFAAVRRGGASDAVSTAVALIGVSVPSFVIAAVLLAVFGFWLGWAPYGQWDGSFSQMILPAIALSLLPMAYVTRLTRVSMIDTLSADYVRTARAKGLGRLAVIAKHALRNAVLPVLSFIGPAAAGTMVGSFVVEKVFNVPGLGQMFVTSVQNRDQTLILGVVMVYSLLLLTLNLLVDVAYTIVDPRIEVAK
ncbi:MAG: ABC transporter permease [Planctomycetota bacterium]